MLRKDLKHLLSLAGHEWYCPFSFVELKTERYLNYVRTITQYERLHIKLDDLKLITEYMIKLSKENKGKELHSALETLNNYVQLDINNDLYFIVANNFLFIDDEPTDKISAKHFEIKKNLYYNIIDVQLFFCEVATSLMKTSENMKDPFMAFQNITSKLNLITEMDFSELMKKINSLKTLEK